MTCPSAYDWLYYYTAQAPKEVEYAKCEDRNLLIVFNSEKLVDYNS